MSSAFSELCRIHRRGMCPEARVRRDLSAGTRVTDSYVGLYTSGAEECAITGSETEYLLSPVRRVCRIKLSTLGRDVAVTPVPTVPNGHRLTLGDHSKVQISS